MTSKLPDPALVASDCRDRFFALNGDLDAVITDDPVHIGYMSGYRSVLQDMPPYSQVLVATRANVYLVTGASDAGAALEVLKRPESIWRYGEFYVYGSCDFPSYSDMPKASETPVGALAAMLQGCKELKVVGLDLRDENYKSAVGSTLPNAKLSGVGREFVAARAVKVPSELDVMRYVSTLTDHAISSVVEKLVPAVSEREIAAEITRTITLGGGVPRFVVVTSGERGSRVDAYASSRTFVDSDIVRLDIGASVSGYYSDMARSYAVGSPTALAADRYASLLNGETAQLKMVRAGITAKTLFEVAMQEVRAGALPAYRRNHCGHGLGLRPHEFPLIGPASETILEPGMVLCLETPYYEIGWGGMMVEDTVIVTETGCEILTHASRALYNPG